jgi:long-chain acyl-CoA synthetase
MQNDQMSSGDKPWFKFWPAHLPKNIEYPDLPAWWILERAFRKFPDKTAIIFVQHEDLHEIQRVTYRDLWEQACSLSAGLSQMGLKKGDRIAVMLPNCPSLIISYYGIWMTGASITPCNVMAKRKELEYQLKDSGACLLIASDELADLALGIAGPMKLKCVLAPAGEPAGNIPPEAIPFAELLRNKGKTPGEVNINPFDDMAVLLYTGGTTGEPKGAELTHRNIVANTIQFAEWYSFDSGREICLCAIPMSHSGGMSGVMNVPVYSGSTLVVMKRFAAESAARLIEKYRATRFFGVPTMYVAILNSRDAGKCDMSSLKACRTNAAPLPVAVKQAFDSLVGKEVLVEGYGLTETSPLTHANPINRAKAGSIGIPLPDTESKVVDLTTGADLPVNSEGELVIRGPQVMKGYWNKPEASSKALAGGWFHTGDVAKMDEDGYFFLVDRLKDMINSGGYKVWPREVEEVLYSHPCVRMAMVIGVPDDYLGETVKAFIVLKNDAGSIKEKEIMAFCKEKMASYKAPRIIEFRDELPISAQGKLLKRLMRDEAGTERPSKGGCSVS